MSVNAHPGGEVPIGATVRLSATAEVVHVLGDCTRIVRRVQVTNGVWSLGYQLPGGADSDVSVLLAAAHGASTSFVTRGNGTYRATCQLKVDQEYGFDTAVLTVGSRDGWIEQGPGPLAADTGLGYRKVAGAIQAVATDPVDRDRVFVASVGGGVWLSTDAVSAVDPTWIPLTDFMPSLSMSAVAISPLDRDTIYAGCGATSHGLPLVGPRSGPLFGLFISSDGGRSWTELARSVFAGHTVTRILPFAQRSEQGQPILVATLGAGLQRSPDGGLTWAGTSPAGDTIFDVAAEPGNASRIYVAGGNGVFRSDDGGNRQWTPLTGAWPVGASVRFSVAPGTDSARSHRIYAAVDGAGLFVSRDAGATWQSMGRPPTSDPTNAPQPVAPIAASPLQPDTVFTDVDDGSHWIARSRSGTGSDTEWTRVDGPGADGTSAHTDGRDAAFSADPNVLFETDDGGIYRLINVHGLPVEPNRRWEEAVGDIRIAEFYALAYDSMHHIVFGATQDNSIPQQTTRSDIVWRINERSYGDGIEVGVDNVTTPGASIHFSSQQELFQFVRRTYTSATTVSADVPLQLVINGTGGETYNQVEGALRDDGGLGTVRFNQSWVLNDADPRRILFGTDYLYESFDRGDTFTSLGGLAKNAKNKWIPANPVGTVTAYAYGHPAKPDVIYVGAGGRLMLRAIGQGLPSTLGNYPGSAPVGITLAGDDWRHAYVLDDQMRVWQTRDAGVSAEGWTDLTGNLATVSPDLRAILALRPRPGQFVFDTVLVAGYGGVFCSTADPETGLFGDWRRLGTGFPNAVATSLSYAPRDDVLAVGTYGRAAWLLRNVLRQVPPNSVMTTDAAPAAAGRRSAAGGGYLFVFAKTPGARGEILFNQAGQGGAFVGWQPVPGGVVTDAPVAAGMQGQTLFVFAKTPGADGEILFNQAAEGGAFVGWQSMPGGVRTDVALAAAGRRSAAGGGYLFVFAKTPGARGEILFNQAGQGGAFVGWQPVPGGVVTDAPVAAGMQGQTLFVFAKTPGADGEILFNQAAEGGAFVGWQRLADQ